MKNPDEIILKLRALEAEFRLVKHLRSATESADIMREAADILQENYDDAVLEAQDPCHDK